MQVRYKKAVIGAFFSLLGFFGLVFFADALQNPIQSQSFATLIDKIATIVAQIGLPLAVVAIIWAGFLFATARGDEQQVSKAKKTFFWSVVGATFIIGAKVFADAVANFAASL